MNFSRLFPFLFLLLFSLSCNPCKKNCENGSCTGNECECDAGWEGEDCDQLIRDQFTGAFPANLICNSGLGNHTVNLTANADRDDKINITNAYNMQATFTGSVNAEYEVLIPNQEYFAFGATTNPDEDFVRGEGFFNSTRDTLRLFLGIQTGGSLDSCAVEIIYP